MQVYFTNLVNSLGNFLPSLLAAIGVLIVGWIIAIIVSGLVRRLLERTTLDDRVGAMLQGSESPRPEQIRVEHWISTAVFWLIIFFSVIAFLSLLNLTAISLPLSTLLNRILGFIPGMISALILLLVAWVIASVLRMIVTRLLSASGFVRRLSEDAQVRPQNRVTLSQTLGNVVYWLVFLLFLPAILDALNMQGILAPVQAMVNEILGYLPNLLGAAIIFAVGLLVARIIRQIVTNLLAGVGVDNLGREVAPSADAAAAASRVRISDVIGLIVYVLILIPVTIAALNALQIPAISEPASNMLNNLLTALPAIFGAFLLIAIAYFAGRIVGRFVATILSGIGFNRFFEQIGLYRAGAAEGDMGAEGFNRTVGHTPARRVVPSMRTSPSEIAGWLVTVAVILFAVMEAAQLMGFEILATLTSQFILSATQVLVGLVIFAVGLYLSAIADRVIRDSGASQAYILAPAARAAIIIFSGALALRQMGIAESIVNLAFGLLLGAVAVAAALAFGLGGREAAARQLDRWQRTLQRAPIPNTGERPDTGMGTGTQTGRGMTGMNADTDLDNPSGPLTPPPGG